MSNQADSNMVMIPELDLEMKVVAEGGDNSVQPLGEPEANDEMNFEAQEVKEG